MHDKWSVSARANSAQGAQTCLMLGTRHVPLMLAQAGSHLLPRPQRPALSCPVPSTFTALPRDSSSLDAATPGSRGLGPAGLRPGHSPRRSDLIPDYSGLHPSPIQGQDPQRGACPQRAARRGAASGVPAQRTWGATFPLGDHGKGPQTMTLKTKQKIHPLP